MKILLTVPIQSLARAPELVDLGLGYVAGACREAGADVTLVDWNASGERRELTRYENGVTVPASLFTVPAAFRRITDERL